MEVSGDKTNPSFQTGVRQRSLAVLFMAGVGVGGCTVHAGEGAWVQVHC